MKTFDKPPTTGVWRARAPQSLPQKSARSITTLCAGAAAIRVKDAAVPAGDEPEEEVEAAPAGESVEGCTLFVKNLNFDSTEEALSKLFAASGPVRSVTIVKKKNPNFVPEEQRAAGKKLHREAHKPMLSLGYGFVEFKTVAVPAMRLARCWALTRAMLQADAAAKALKKQQNFVLDGHQLQLKARARIGAHV
jgi:multiple RNA-binding domain-containing protein 1